ncbi:hypothetical protein [Paenibacillus cisolokensis]|uniref:hypothetical protein n=1 Tax=Paenibacillus cisolokensis TaxID=1658519 RepID=UPI001BD0F433|nr:hypothetical protein [Paenibacillus cisolokensis]
MLIRIDHTEENYAFTSDEHFQTVWESIKNKLNEQNRYIAQVSFNGEVQSADFEAMMLSRYKEIREIEIISVSEAQLIDDTLKDVQSFSGKIVNACDSIGSLFYGDISAEQWNMASSLLEAVEWVIQSLSGAANLLSKYPEETDYVAFVEDAVRSLKHNLADLGKALESEDYLSVGDIMKYELADTFKKLGASILTNR